MTRPRISTTALSQLRERMSGYVEAGHCPGVVMLVASGDDVHVEAIGTMSFDGLPMSRDTVFRIASLTKPMVAAVTMSLVDSGALHLDTRVDEILPEMSDRRVLRSIDAELDDTVPAVRPIVVEDLLTLTFGFGTVMSVPGDYPFQVAEAQLDLATLRPPWPPTPHAPDEWLRLFASLPLLYQPGERWLYNTGLQVLGVLISRCAGAPLEALMRERLFEPLGMTETAMSVRPDQVARLATMYTDDPDSGSARALDEPHNSFWGAPPSFPNGGGGLVSTIDDVWAFVSMLLAGGSHGGVRVIDESSVRLMLSERLTPQQRASGEPFLSDRFSWGYGLGVPPEGVRDAGLQNGVGWDGGAGVTWRSDLDRRLTGIVLTQREMTSPESTETFNAFFDGIEQAVAQSE